MSRYVFLLLALLVAPLSATDFTPYNPNKPFLGVSYGISPSLNVSPTKSVKAIHINMIIPETAAAQSGLKSGDYVLQFDTHVVDTVNTENMSLFFRNYIQKNKQIGDPFSLKVYRKKQTIQTLNSNRKKPISMAALTASINQQAAGEKLELRVETQAILLDLNIPLGTRPGIMQDMPPSNALLFPILNNQSDPFSALGLKAIKAFNLTDSYQDLLTRFQQNERWDAGFRLPYLRFVHQDPLKLPIVAETITTPWIAKKRLPDMIRHAAHVIDVNPILKTKKLPRVPSNTANLDAHIAYMTKIVALTNHYHVRAFRDISVDAKHAMHKQSTILLQDFIKDISLSQSSSKEATLKYLKLRSDARKVDFKALLHAGWIMAHLANPQWLTSLKIAIVSYKKTHGSKNGLILTKKTKVGDIVIGDTGPNRHLSPPTILIDLGGDDLYTQSSAGTLHGTSTTNILIDFDGHDTYSSSSTSSQGSGFFGSALLIDRKGNDTYRSTNLSQGAGFFGVGILLDEQGNDSYIGQAYAQGLGFWGIGMLIDGNGNDAYAAALYGQGTGGPKALGLLLDRKGNDTYRLSTHFESSYGAEGIFKGYGQGFGIGIRHLVSGGIGVLFDQEGKDHFEGGNFSQGGGYFYGFGILRNGGKESDTYIGSRYGQGCSAHSAVGILLEEGGDDRYSGLQGALQSAAWDMSISALIDYEGDDQYQTPHQFFSLSSANHNGFSLFYDLKGTDTYTAQPKIHKPNNTYHEGTSLSLFVDPSGQADFYEAEPYTNNSQNLHLGTYMFFDLPHALTSTTNPFSK
jgi:hypothetical protein